MKNVYLRKSCYDCQFRSFQRNSDITIADYWGVHELCPKMFDDKGTSIVFTHTAIGEAVLWELGDVIELLPQSKENAVKFNPSMDRENPKDLKRKRFFWVFRLTSFERALYVIDKDVFYIRGVRKVKKCMRRLLNIINKGLYIKK